MALSPQELPWGGGGRREGRPELAGRALPQGEPPLPLGRGEDPRARRHVPLRKSAGGEGEKQGKMRKKAPELRLPSALAVSKSEATTHHGLRDASASPLPLPWKRPERRNRSSALGSPFDWGIGRVTGGGGQSETAGGLRGRFRAVARSDRYCWGDTEAGGCADQVVVCRALSGDIHRVKHSAAVSINFIDFAARVWQGRASPKVARSGCRGLALPVPQGLLIPAPGSVVTYLCVWGKYYLPTQGVASDFWPRKHTVNYSQILGMGFQILWWELALCLRAEFLPRLRAQRIAEADLAFYSNLWQNVLSKKARLFYFLWTSLKKTQTRKLWAEVQLKVHFFFTFCIVAW